jgi:hypothetical protein
LVCKGNVRLDLAARGVIDVAETCGVFAIGLAAYEMGNSPQFNGSLHPALFSVKALKGSPVGQPLRQGVLERRFDCEGIGVASVLWIGRRFAALQRELDHDTVHENDLAVLALIP